MRTAASSEAAQNAQGERKAKLLLASMFIGGLALLAGLLYIGSRFLEQAKEENSTLAQVSAIDESRSKAEDERRAQQQKEVQEREDKRRADEVDRIAKVLSLNVCEGDDLVATELAKMLVDVSADLTKSFENGVLPSNLVGYVEERLLTRMTENATLRHWFGKRSPQVFAHSVATLMFGPRQANAGLANPGNPLPEFLTSGRYHQFGSGFLVSPDGWLLTNHHVVNGGSLVDVRLSGGKILHARVVKSDRAADIALLKTEIQTPRWLPLSKGTAPMGASVFTIGFPRPDRQGVEPKFTDGRISSFSGIQDDKNQYQISVPVQHGNSGGPLVHMESGWVVGMVCAKLAAQEEDIPENVNYAIKSGIIRRFVESVPEAKTVIDGEMTLPKTQEEIIGLVKASVVMVLVGRS